MFEDHSENFRSNNQHSWLAQLHREDPEGGEKHLKRGAKIGRGGPLFSPGLLGQQAFVPRGCIFLYFLNKTEL